MSLQPGFKHLSSTLQVSSLTSVPFMCYFWDGNIMWGGFFLMHAFATQLQE
jgi:hypothetical protein